MNNQAKKICVIGTGHLGCVVSACLSEMGNIVYGVDFDKKIITNLSKGVPSIFEPKLEQLIKKNIKKDRLKYVHNFQSALKEADYIFITFDTPVDNKDKSNQEQQSKPDQISKEDAQRLLDALNNDEKKVQDKLKKKKGTAVKVEIDKDW